MEDSRSEEDVHKTTKSVYFSKQKNKGKQYHHLDIDKTVIRALNKLDMSYNPVYLNCIYDKFKQMKLHDTLQEKPPIHQYNSHFSVLSSAYIMKII